MHNVLVCMPLMGRAHPRSAFYLRKLQVRQIEKKDCTVIEMEKQCPVDIARNRIVKTFLNNEAFTHLFMFDSDVVPPDDALDKMLELDEPMVSGPTPIMLQLNIVANVTINKGWVRQLPKEPFYADASGCGCVLYKRQVFLDVPWPWFEYKEEWDGRLIGEDISFSYKAAEYGYKYCVHPKVICGHYKEFDLRVMSKVIQKSIEERTSCEVQS